MDEQKVIDTRLFSSYKGVPVIKLPIGGNAFSFGILFIGSKVTDASVIRHEYGHYLQLKQKGIFRYIRDVAVPSVLCYHLDRNKALPYRYYGSPWEHEADLAGGVDRNVTLWPAYTSSSEPSCRRGIYRYTKRLLAERLKRIFHPRRKH